MDLVKRLEEYRDRERDLQWEGTFAQYFEIATKKPEVARLSHERIYHMIMDAGFETTRNGEPNYNFFSQEIFGIEKPLQQIVEYFHSAAQRLEVRKRILLLMGPVGGGKSTIVYLLKRGSGSLQPHRAGRNLRHQRLPHARGAAAPDSPRSARRCRKRIWPLYRGRPVSPLPLYGGYAISRPHRRCTGETHRLQRKISHWSRNLHAVRSEIQDISELVGGIDLSTIGEVGVESDPRAYRFDGELNIANRGLMEFVEMLKTDEKFLYVLLTLSQEQNIKTGRFSMIYADEVVASHTNEHEYQAFVGNKKSEALQDRIILVKVPYNLRASDEVKIYEKLLKQSALQNVHIAPYTLRIASVFAVLTRLEPSKKAGMSIMKKLKLYDGEDIEDFKQKDIKELQDEAVREGMDGISPRYVINRLSSALVKQNTTCINPIDALRALRDGLDQHTSITREERERYLNFIQEARKEYDDMARKEVQRAFVYSYEESARTLLNNYLDNVEAFCNKTRLRDPITDEDMEPDEQLMRSIEEQIGISENAKKGFREEILIRISSLARKGMTFDYTSHERLKEAIEKKLFADLRDVVKITTSTRTPDKEQLRKINEVVNRLMAEHGYCHVCANEILRYTGSLLNR